MIEVPRWPAFRLATQGWRGNIAGQIMTDAEILQQFLVREQRWLQVLHTLRNDHETHLGKVTTGVPIHSASKVVVVPLYGKLSSATSTP